MKYLFQISLSILLILISTLTVLNKPYMYINENMYPSHEQITWDYKYVSEQIVDYLHGERDDFAFPSNPDGSDVLMTNRAITHMADVKQLVDTGKTIGIFLFVVVIMLGIYLYDRKKLNNAFRTLWQIPIVVFTIFFLAILIDFQTTFVIFHKLLFSNDLWLLAANDPLIIMLPTGFFFTSALVIVFTAVLLHAIFIICSYLYYRKKHPKN